MALDKKREHPTQNGYQNGNVIWSPFVKWPPSSFFPKIAVYFKLNYFKLKHLQANMLSSFILTYYAVNHTNLPHNLSFRLRKHKI